VVDDGSDVGFGVWVGAGVLMTVGLEAVGVGGGEGVGIGVDVGVGVRAGVDVGVQFGLKATVIEGLGEKLSWNLRFSCVFVAEAGNYECI
jgi:hypothetical protein